MTQQCLGHPGTQYKQLLLTEMLLQGECARNTSELFQDLRGIHFKIVHNERTEYSLKRYFNEQLQTLCLIWSLGPRYATASLLHPDIHAKIVSTGGGVVMHKALGERERKGPPETLTV